MRALLSSKSFCDWQPVYAEHHIPTFPVQIGPDGKKPMVASYGRFGLPASTGIARRFPDATGIGFMVGQRTGITVLDIDSPDERVLADALNRHGPTPVIVRSGSGNHQAWYRYNGENRLIRKLEPGKPIDLLGSGFVVAPPSRGIKGDYQFIEGGLDDLGDLPTLQNTKIASPLPFSPASTTTEVVTKGNRNDTLWRYCMRTAHYCDDFDALLDVARTANDKYMPPLSDEDVVKVATSAWKCTESGKNRFGQRGAWLPQTSVNALVRDPELFALIGWLKAANGPNAEFLVADGLHKLLGWSMARLRKARRKAIDTGWIVKIRHEAKGVAALYRWGPAACNR